jgi:hypothetical protein
VKRLNDNARHRQREPSSRSARASLRRSIVRPLVPVLHQGD